MKTSLATLVVASCAALSCAAGAVPIETQGVVTFTYDGAEFACRRPVAERELPGGRGWTSKVFEYATPDKKLGVRVTWKFYADFAAAEYVPELYALTGEKTGLVTDFASFSFVHDDGKPKWKGLATRVRTLRGDKCNAELFTPDVRWCCDRNWLKFGAYGRSSDSGRELPAVDHPSGDELYFAKRYPWFNNLPAQLGSMPYICFDFPQGDGLDIAVGWSGSWRCECLKWESKMYVKAGLAKTRFRVLPGETLRTPSITVFRRAKGTTPREMRTVKHRFMLAMKSPRDAKGALIGPVLPVTFDGGMRTDEMMMDLIRWTRANKLPFDAFWVDANWNGDNPKMDPNSWKDWNSFLGTWTANRIVHPDGNLAKVADFAHANGAKFILWGEPERICTNTAFAALPPECLLKWDDPRNKKGFLTLNLGSEGGCTVAIDTIESFIRDSHIDVYRQDCNIYVFNRFWDVGDEAAGPDRVGVTEMKYIAGLYRFWDTVRGRHPDLLIDNCASGGRRIDIELASRSHNYCRSDFFIKNRGDDQILAAQNTTLNTLDIQPFQASESNPANVGDEYAFFSAMGSSIVFTPAMRGFRYNKHDGISDADMAWLRRMFTVADKMRPYFFGDFYPQTEPTGLDRDIWCAYQMHRPDRNSGFVLAFRRSECPTDTFLPSLGGVKDDALYALTSWDGTDLGTCKGSELRNRPIKVAEKRGFAMFFYSSLPAATPL